MEVSIQPFLDEEGRLRQWPVKHAVQLAALSYLYEKFEVERDYTEKEVNAILTAWHTFGDYFLLRRGMVDEAFLMRVPDGSRYWRSPALPVQPPPRPDAGKEKL